MKFIFNLFPWLGILNPATIRADILAGITAGVLILPQAIALAQLAGLPPEFGIYTSLFPVVIAALGGSSWHNLSGPNTALCILIGIAIAPYANEASPEWIQYAITLAFMAGIIQIFFGILRLGSVFNYFSNTVIVSLVTGVGIIIILQQFGHFMGVVKNTSEPVEDILFQIFYALERANYFAVLTGLVTVCSGLLINKFAPRWPYIISAVIIGTITASLLNFFFSYGTTELERLGNVSLSAIPLSAADFSAENFSEASEGLISAAFLIAFLGLMQSSIITKSMAAKSGQRININREVIGQGLSNIVGSFLSCFPSSGSFNRSVANYEAGARTPLAAIVSVFALAILVILATPLIAYLPLSVMAGILILVGLALINLQDISRIMRLRGEARLVFIIILLTTLFAGLDIAVILGICLSVIGYLRSASTPEIEILSEIDKSQYVSNGQKTTVLKITGNLFFGSVHVLEQALTDVALRDGRRHCLVIAAENVPHIDLSGMEIISREAQERQEAGGHLHIWIAKDKVIDSRIKDEFIRLIGRKNLIIANN